MPKKFSHPFGWLNFFGSMSIVGERQNRMIYMYQKIGSAFENDYFFSGCGNRLVVCYKINSFLGVQIFQKAHGQMGNALI
jgi:hypothetical protein